MRSVLIDWLVEVAQEYRLVSETLCLTVDYVDRYLSVVPTPRNQLQLVGVTCMLLASKYEEIYAPTVGFHVLHTSSDHTIPFALPSPSLQAVPGLFNVNTAFWSSLQFQVQLLWQPAELPSQADAIAAGGGLLLHYRKHLHKGGGAGHREAGAASPEVRADCPERPSFPPPLHQSCSPLSAQGKS